MRDDELELLRAVNPVRADEGPWRDRPLHGNAERALNQLLSNDRRRRARRSLVLRAEGAVLAVAAALAVALACGAPAALADPAPSCQRTSSADAGSC
ncbi:hypothetical protein ACQB60_14500 [Actinomycetota bacterium Odt1-20B]